MLIGDKQRFAIELDILDVVDGWVLGTFNFWISGIAIGDLQDKSVDLKGCVNWLKELVGSRNVRFEPGLYDLDKEQIYIELCDSVLAGDSNSFVQEKYTDTYSRFHISHIGMSSFDNVTMVLVENEHSDVRFVWKQNDQNIEEAFFKSEEFNKIAVNAIEYFDGIMSNKKAK